MRRESLHTVGKDFSKAVFEENFNYSIVYTMYWEGWRMMSCSMCGALIYGGMRLDNRDCFTVMASLVESCAVVLVLIAQNVG